MRTKLILGLTVGVMAAVQTSSAQEVTSGVPGSAFQDQGAIVNSDTVAMPAPIKDVTDSEVSSFINPNDDKSSSASALGDVSFNFGDIATPQNGSAIMVQNPPALVATTADSSRRQSKSSVNFTGDWMNLGDVSVPPSLTATTSESIVPPANAGSEFASNPSMDNNADGLLRSEARAGSSGSAAGGGRMPMMASPEPGTVSLLVLGGGVVLNAVRRRKQTS